VIPHGLCTPLLIDYAPWKDISMDFVLGLPRTRRAFYSIFVVVDRFSKMTNFIPYHKLEDESNIAKLFLREIVKLYGWPRTTILDRDPIIYGEHFGKDWKQNWIFPHLIILKHGQNKVVNISSSAMLRVILKSNHRSWDEYLSYIEFAYNSVV